MAGIAFFKALNFLIVENFLSAEECAAFREAMDRSPATPAEILIMVEDSGVETVDEQLRSTRRVDVVAEVRDRFAAALDAIRDRAGAHFGVALEKTEKPQFLLYREGDFFLRHLDRDQIGKYHRLVSVIVFLNDDFEGGTLKFYGGVDEKMLELRLAPARGMLVGFRADWFHEVEPVIRGMRYTVVSWFA